MAMQLTKGAIPRLFSSGRRETCTVQVLGMKLLSNQQTGQPPRWRISISDGDYQGAATLASQLNPIIDSGQLKQNTIITITDFVINSVGGTAGPNATPHRLIVILKCGIVSQMDGVIGNPVKYTTDESGGTANRPGPTPTSNPASASASSSIQSAPPANRPSNAMASGNSATAVSRPPSAYPTNINAPSAQPQRMQQQQPAQQMQRQSPPLQTAAQPLQRLPPQQPAPQSSSLQAQTQYRRSTPSIEMNPSDLPAIQPISTLNPYNTRWTIKARITKKSEIREWNNQKGSGKLFSVDLVDSEGGEIRATMFNRALEKWFPLIEEGQIYMISRGLIKPTNKKFTAIAHDYELSLDENSIIQPSNEDNTIPALKFNLVKISELQNIEPDSTIDVIGIVTKIGPVTDVTLKSRGTNLPKQTITLVDDSNVGVELTLWGSAHAGRNDIAEGEVVAAKHVRISTFNGISLSASQASVITVNPPIPDVDQLHAWYRQQTEQGGGTIQAEMISRPDANRQSGTSSGRRFIRKTFAQVKEQRLGFQNADGSNAAGDTFWTKAFLSFVRVPQDSGMTGGAPTTTSGGSMWYPACPNEACKKKKVIDNHNGTWSCEKCNQTYDQVEFRYVLQCQIVDNTGNQWCTAFNDQATGMLGITANDLASQVTESGSIQSISDVVDECLFTEYSLKVRAKAEMVNDEERLKCVIVDARKVDPTKEAFTVLNDIREYHNRGLMPGSATAASV